MQPRDFDMVHYKGTNQASQISQNSTTQDLLRTLTPNSSLGYSHQHADKTSTKAA